MGEKDFDQMDWRALAEERLRLEREALDIERRRLVASRSRIEEESKIMARRMPPWIVGICVLALSIAFFCAGVLSGIGAMEYKSHQARSARLSAALSQLSGATVSTNSSALPPAIKTTAPKSAHSGVSVILIQ